MRATCTAEDITRLKFSSVLFKDVTVTSTLLLMLSAVTALLVFYDLLRLGHIMA